MEEALSEELTIFATLVNKNQLIAEHSKRVSAISVLIGQSLGLSNLELGELEIGGLLHDIGKLGLSQSVLRKPGRLTEEEFRLVRSHPVLGGNFVEAVGYNQNIINVVRYHHERLDGSGYPFGLKHHKIPLTSRIVAVADVFEAMTADRPYRTALSIGEALQELEQREKYDASVVQVFKSRLSTTGPGEFKVKAGSEYEVRLD